MRSVTTRKFREMYSELPEHIQSQARRAYQLFKDDPWHPGLHFKKIDVESVVYSVRVSLNYRALGRVADDTII